MSDQVVPEFGERVRSAVVAGERLAERLKQQEGATMNVLSSPEYQELVRLKVVIDWKHPGRSPRRRASPRRSRVGI
jgi:hypothetical protein